MCPSGEVGRRARFRFWYRKVCEFESHLGHHIFKELSMILVYTKIDGKLALFELDSEPNGCESYDQAIKAVQGTLSVRHRGAVLALVK